MKIQICKKKKRPFSGRKGHTDNYENNDNKIFIFDEDKKKGRQSNRDYWSEHKGIIMCNKINM